MIVLTRTLLGITVNNISRYRLLHVQVSVRYPDSPRRLTEHALHEKHHLLRVE